MIGLEWFADVRAGRANAGKRMLYHDEKGRYQETEQE
jgi:hypothetical protein